MRRSGTFVGLLAVVSVLTVMGLVMVLSSSSVQAIRQYGSPWVYFERQLLWVAVGAGAMAVCARLDYRVWRRFSGPLVVLALVLLVMVLVPGVGVLVDGSSRWVGTGSFRIQPSELMKLALVLYGARHLGESRTRRRGARHLTAPIAVVAGAACLLIVVEPDLGTTLVIAFTMAALLVAAGMPLRYLALLAALAAGLVLLLAVVQPYERARLTSFLHPWASANRASAGYQAVQGQIALGSGGLVGVGLGRSVQKIFYLPEAQTDFILAVIGEELGVLGILGVAFLYGMIAYAGLRTARRAAGRYAKLLATGLTSLILCQGILNIFVVLGLAPLTGVPLPFISYAPTNLCVMLAAVGLLLNMARGRSQRLRMLEAPGFERSEDRDRRWRDRRARRAGAGRGRRAAR